MVDFNSDLIGGLFDGGVWNIGAELTLDTDGSIEIPVDSHGVYPVDTFEDAGSDDLSTISGTVSAGRIIILYPASGARTVTVKDNVRLQMAGDFNLNNAYDIVMLMSRGGGIYCELSRGNNGA